MSRRTGLRPRWPTAIVVVGSVALVVAFVLTLGSPQSSAPEAGVTAPTASPAATEKARPTGTPRATPSPSASSEPTPDPALLVPVLVFNQTATAGLAAAASAAVEAGGWDVVETGDASLGVPSTTLYVPPGLEDSAAAFVAQFPAVTRQRPAFEGLSTSALTLVLAEPDAVSVVDGLAPPTRVTAAG